MSRRGCRCQVSYGVGLKGAQADIIFCSLHQSAEVLVAAAETRIESGHDAECQSLHPVYGYRPAGAPSSCNCGHEELSQALAQAKGSTP